VGDSAKRKVTRVDITLKRRHFLEGGRERRLKGVGDKRSNHVSGVDPWDTRRAVYRAS